jgi:hypothetical protein
VTLRACALLLTLLCTRAHAQAEPASVTIAGTFQSELGCLGDWDAACEATWLERNPVDGVWRRLFTVPGGVQEFKAALNGSWEENYRANAVRDGDHLVFSHTEDFVAVKFFYDPVTHWVTNSTLTSIAVVAGSFQSELGCPGDWDPACMISWLKDIDGDGVQELRIPFIPAGSYELKVAHHESWDENYGLNGEFYGPNIPLTVPEPGHPVRFSYDTPSHRLTITLSIPTTTELTVTPNPASQGAKMTLTAKVTTTGAEVHPSGLVTFKADGTTLDSVPVGLRGVATTTVNSLLGGTYAMTAEYAGLYEPSVSQTVVLQVETSDAGTGGTDAGTDAGSGNGDAGPGDTDAGPGNSDAGPGDTDAGPGNNDAGPGDTDAGPGNSDAGPGNTDAGPGNSDAGPGDTDAGPGNSDAGSDGTDAGPGNSDAGPGNSDAGPGNTDAGPGNTDAGAGDTDAGSGDTDAGSGEEDAGPGDADAGPGSDDAGPGNSDAGAGDADAGTGDTDDAGTSDNPLPPDDTTSGCGCGAGGGSPLLLLGMWLGLTAFQSRRRSSTAARG